MLCYFAATMDHQILRKSVTFKHLYSEILLAESDCEVYSIVILVLSIIHESLYFGVKLSTGFSPSSRDKPVLMKVHCEPASCNVLWETSTSSVSTDAKSMQ